ncbi:MAG: PEP-CTERM sorting domain-containing protein [Acidobacteriia bacterium]|nr:PEP-CTERM sorting domain-containing protein [Terriglobia bacterium]
MFEYTMPSDVPIGLIQSGQFFLQCQLYDANPDLQSANPVGDPVTLASDFDVVASASSETPEPTTIVLMGVAIGILIRHSRARRVRP